MGIESVLLKCIPTLVSLLEYVYNQGILVHVLIGLFIIESVLSSLLFWGRRSDLFRWKIMYV